MEFNFRIADIFPAEISIVDDKLIPKNSPGIQKLGVSVVQTRMTQILDVVGKASAEAQNLQQIITNAEKLRQSSGQDQVVYFLLDFVANQVVGLLKIGRKKLFVYDQAGVVHEMNPMCILDFYIHESRQRVGCGRLLFEAMLKNEGIRVEHLAIDRPSDKLIYFLRKHYGLENMIPQVNNFAIFDGFFMKRTDYAGKKAKWTGLDQPDERNNYHPHAHGKAASLTTFQDSRSYNTTPALHLRNNPHNDASSIGNVVQPPYRNGNGQQRNGNGHTSMFD